MQIAHRGPAVRLQGDRRTPAGPDPVCLSCRVPRYETRDDQAWASRRGSHRDRYAFAGSFASAAAASSSSFSASSRLPAASSFLTSFSTVRRLYDWFQ